jgi:hypothetical protein
MIDAQILLFLTIQQLLDASPFSGKLPCVVAWQEQLQVETSMFVPNLKNTARRRRIYTTQ